MNLQDAVKIANQEMTKHLQLEGWVFRLDRSRSRFGCCDSRLHVISLSKALTLLNPEKEVLDTIRHEIAHALVGPEHGHDRIWKRMCMVVPGPVRGVLTRLDVPVVTYSNPSATQTGLGDIYMQALVAPRSQGNFAVAAGTGLQMPTATSASLGMGKWIASPAIVPIWFIPRRG